MQSAQLEFIYNLSLAVVLWATSIRIGLTIAPGELVRSVLQVRALARGLVLNLLVLPALVWGMTRWLAVDAETTIGLVLLAVTPGGPFGLVAAQMALGDTALAVLLISILQAARLVTIPLWLGIFFSFGPQEIFQVLAVLLLYIFLPLLIGLGIQRFFSARSRRWVKPTGAIANLALVVLIASAIWLYLRPLLELVFSTAMLLILLIQATSFGLGYAFGNKPGERRTLAVTAIVRSSAAALVLTTQVYAGQPQIAATVIAYGVSALLMATVAALGLARLERSVVPQTDSAETT